MKRRPWTAAEDAALIEGARRGMRARQIGDQLGRSKSATWIRRVHFVDLGLLEPYVAIKPWQPADDRTLKAMLRQGCTNKQIARVLGRTIWAVEAHRKTLGLTRKSEGVVVRSVPHINTVATSAINNIEMVVEPWQTMPDGTLRRLIYRAEDAVVAEAMR